LRVLFRILPGSDFKRSSQQIAIRRREDFDLLRRDALNIVRASVESERWERPNGSVESDGRFMKAGRL
jgi:hypothetical protein